MTRPRTLRLLYSALAFTALLGLYWLAGLHSEEAVTGHRQPDTQDYHGRGLKTKPSSSERSVEARVESKVTKSDPSPQRLTQLTENAQAVPQLDVMKTQESIARREQLRARNQKKFGKRKRPPMKTKPTLFSLADYKPGEDSPPLNYGVNVTLTRLNMEFSEEAAAVSKANTGYKVMPSFDSEEANTMEIVGNVRVGSRVPVHSARHVIVLTTWRSGSTFLGDLLNHYKGVFYYFEPLHYYSKSKYKAGAVKPKQNQTEFLKSLFECQFNEENIGYLHHVSKADNKFLFKNHNFRLWNSCHNLLPNDMLCLMPEYLTTVCPLFPIKLIKTVRIQLREIESLLVDPALGLRVVFLVRDPRGTYNSRSSGTISKWCVKDECANPAVGCDLMHDNIKMAHDLETRFPGTIKLVRYEDLSMFTEDVTIDLLDFLDLPFTEEISAYIDSHTNSDKKKIVRNKKTHKLEHKNNPYGTTKNSTATAFAWREKLSFENIRKIQSACKEPMAKLGYKLYESEDEVTSSTLPLSNNLDEIWPFQSP